MTRRYEGHSRERQHPVSGPCLGLTFREIRNTRYERRAQPYPVSGPRSSPLQSTQHQSPSINDIGSPQMPQSGAGPLSRTGRIGSSISSSFGSVTVGSCGLRFHFELQRLFGALPTWHSHEGQTAVDDRGGHRPNGVPIGQLLPISRGDVHLTIAKAILYPQFLPEALR